MAHRLKKSALSAAVLNMKLKQQAANKQIKIERPEVSQKSLNYCDILIEGTVF